jgi:hypothetical protein
MNRHASKFTALFKNNIYLEEEKYLNAISVMKVYSAADALIVLTIKYTQELKAFNVSNVLL